MEERGLGFNQLGQRIGVSGQTVSTWRSGASRPTPENCRSLAEFFRRPVREVLQLNEYPTGSDDDLSNLDLKAEAARATDLFEQGIEILRQIRDRLDRQEPPERP